MEKLKNRRIQKSPRVEITRFLPPQKCVTTDALSKANEPSKHDNLMN